MFVIDDFQEPNGFCLNHGLEHDENDYYFSLICKSDFKPKIPRVVGILGYSVLSLLNEVFNMIVLSYSVQKSLKHMTYTGYDFLSITAIGDLCIILIGVFGMFINLHVCELKVLITPISSTCRSIRDRSTNQFAVYATHMTVWGSLWAMSYQLLCVDDIA